MHDQIDFGVVAGARVWIRRITARRDELGKQAMPEVPLRAVPTVLELQIVACDNCNAQLVLLASERIRRGKRAKEADALFLLVAVTHWRGSMRVVRDG